MQKTPLEPIISELSEQAGVRLFMKRDDLIHPLVSGNKWRKLKYNLENAKKQGHDTLLTFGGAFSNHIYSLAAAGELHGFKTIGVIRGEEILPLNPTLSFAKNRGMKFHYLNREAYRNKYSQDLTESLHKAFGNFYLVPEGGTNEFAVKGVSELVDEIEIHFDYITCPVGTGGTLAGIATGLKTGQKALGFATLKGQDYLETEVKNLLSGQMTEHNTWQIVHDYHFGGYAKITAELVSFMIRFETETGIPLDPVYTGKMMYGLMDQIRKGFFEKGKTIIVLHTGGLQGVAGMKPRMDKILRL